MWYVEASLDDEDTIQISTEEVVKLSTNLLTELVLQGHLAALQASHQILQTVPDLRVEE